ncbi:MAG: universal stress protein [Caulobacteraceae bacterium]
MAWARILAPLCGGESDRRTLGAAAIVAEAFDSELACVHAPADVAELLPWMGEGYTGGVQSTALESIRQAAVEGAAAARAAAEAVSWSKKSFSSLESPVAASLAMEGRLSDLVVFDDSAGRGKGPLASVFQQVVANEQRPTLVARPDLRVGGVVAIAWDAGKEASRAMRTALPLLQKASKVVALTAGAARDCDPSRLQAFLAARGVACETQKVLEPGDPATALMRAARSLSADLLVAGAYGHPRLQEFIFGGATRAFLHAEGPSLFLSH